MVFKAVIHNPASQEQIQEIHKAVAQFRAEKAAKYLGALGVTYDTIRECLQQEKIYNADSKAS